MRAASVCPVGNRPRTVTPQRAEPVTRLPHIVLLLACLFAIPMAGYTAPGQFFAQKLMPPPDCLSVSTGKWFAVYPNGIVIRAAEQRLPSQSVSPPLPKPGETVTHSFTWQMEVEVSTDGGTTYSPSTASASSTIRLSFQTMNGDEEVHAGEMQELAFEALPGILVRESPTLASSGQTRLRPVPGGFMISSFFDIFTEVSADGGLSWRPTSQAAKMQLLYDPWRIEPVLSPRLLAPMPNGQYASRTRFWQAYANGIIIADVRNRLFSQWQELPPLGEGTAHPFSTQADLQLSFDNGLTWQRAHTTGHLTFTCQSLSECSGSTTYDATLTQFEIGGSGIPGGVMIRESPTRTSSGGATSKSAGGGGGGGGGYIVSSFFDIFTEVSIDGGASWAPATNAPARVELSRVATPHDFESERQLTPCSTYVSQPPWFSLYASGVVISNLLCHAYADTFLPPPPGATETHSFGAEVKMQLSYDGGATYNHATAPALLTVQTTGRLGGDGFTDYYDTEMLELNISGGDLPAGLQLRESPTRASLGRTTTTERIGGGYQIDSFFDIFTEISTDGGMAWQPNEGGPGTVTLQPPEPLTITCPADMTVRAATRAGIAVAYPPPGVDGGCPPYTVVCTPPSGSFFPLGVTAVSCVVSDACDQVTNCSFTITVLRPLRKSFFARTLLPPPPSMYFPPEPQLIVYENGLLVRAPAHRLFLSSTPPPASPGTSLTHTFGSQVEMEVSLDGGLTWFPCTAPASVQVYIRNDGPDAGDTRYFTEMQQLDISGGGLPPGVMVRESPTLASAGETRIQLIAGGYMIDSFFDIFTEVSTDGGMTWSPALQPCALELKKDPALIEPTLSPRAVEPMPLGQYVSELAYGQEYANGIILRRMRNTLFTQWESLPTPGNTQAHTFDSQLDFELSLSGGVSWQMARVPGTMSYSSRNVRLFSGQTTFETAVTQLDMSGGGLPAGVMIRESPTRASKGGIARQPFGDGYQVSSFFDIFTEISTDGGASWAQATNGPLHMKLQNVSPQVEFPTPNEPPPTGQYVSSTPWHAYYACGVIITSAVHRFFTQSWPPPPPGGSEIHSYGTTVTLAMSAGGGPFTQMVAPAQAQVRETSLRDEEDTRYFDTEMLQLDIAGGDLPAGVMIRESPTRASTGRTSIRSLPSGNFMISSFFDIFTELSLDGGQTWQPSLSGPGTVTLEPPPPLEITCPGDVTMPATDWSGRVVHYPPPTTSGGIPPITVTCTPPSGSLFPIGVTPVTCQAWDGIGQTDMCSFTVTVVKVTEIDDFTHSVARLTLQGPAGGSETVGLAGSSRMEVYVGPGGEAEDTDSDGLDDAAAELTEYSLRGYCSLLGAPVRLRRNTGTRTAGKHEERVNATPGILDIPPFTPAGTCDSFFDVFAEIEVGGQALYPASSFRIDALIHHKPPAPGELYVTSPQLSVPLLDGTGKPSGITLVGLEFMPATTVETDVFKPMDTFISLRLPNGVLESVRLTGEVKTRVYFEGAEGIATDNDGDGRDDVLQEVSSLDLSGVCGMGPLVVHIALSPISLGQLEEQVNANVGLLDVPPFWPDGTCDSFFDVFYLLTIGGQTFHNTQPWRLSGVVSHKPCAAGELLTSVSELPVDMFDETGAPTLVQLIQQWLVLTQPDLDIKPASPTAMQLSWPTPSTGYLLQTSSNLAPPIVWADVTNTPLVGEDRKTVTLERATSNQFFKLMRPLP